MVVIVGVSKLLNGRIQVAVAKPQHNSKPVQSYVSEIPRPRSCHIYQDCKPTFHGMKMPFPLPQIAGAVVASGHITKLAGKRAANVTQELKATLPEEYFRTRTEAEAPETFTYKNPDEGWSESTRAGVAQRIKAAKQHQNQ
jgi:hypothetical protein